MDSRFYDNERTKYILSLLLTCPVWFSLPPGRMTDSGLVTSPKSEAAKSQIIDNLTLVAQHPTELVRNAVEIILSSSDGEKIEYNFMILNRIMFTVPDEPIPAQKIGKAFHLSWALQNACGH